MHMAGCETAVMETSCVELTGDGRLVAIRTIRENHYSRSVPSGKSYYYRYGPALVVISIPANQFIGRFLFGTPRETWELSRLWAPDGHERNLLTRAISCSVQAFKQRERDTWALVSYADPNVGHSGLVYRAASWIACGQVQDSRYYRSSDTGTVVSRRKFHSGGVSLKKADILALGYTETKQPGRYRYCLPLTATARRHFLRKWA